MQRCAGCERVSVSLSWLFAAAECVWVLQWRQREDQASIAERREVAETRRWRTSEDRSEGNGARAARRSAFL